jgi:ParB family transcriptional regulator, chromosome partitioning protein
MAMVQRRLGRGLDFLLSGGAEADAAEVAQLDVARIRPNPFQPRREFRAEELEELAASIREHGLLQPIIVRPVGDDFEIVAGERRVRACQRLGLATVPALVRTATDTQMLELALIENIQRADLNAIEEARAYQSYIQRLDLTQEQAAQRLGRSRPTVANMLRLLDLPPDVQELVSRGTISMGHARALLALTDAESQRALARRIESERLSVREVERLAKQPPAHAPAGATSAPINAHLKDVESQLAERLATRVTIRDRGGPGRLVIDYYSAEDLGRLVELIGGASAAVARSAPAV